MTLSDGLVALGNTVLDFWGFWLFLFGLVFIFLFRTHIGALISRVTKLGAGKYAAEAQEPNPEQRPPTAIAESLSTRLHEGADPRRAADELIGKLSRAPWVVLREDVLKQSLSEQGLVPSSTETHRVLIAYLATALVAAEFEQLYNTLWTTQMQLLTEANPRAPVGLTVDEIRAYYDLGASMSPAIYAHYTFDGYLNFLLTQSLLTAAEVPGHYTITVKGRSMLLYFVHEGKSLTGRIY
jgi:hypothetical protein